MPTYQSPWDAVGGALVPFALQAPTTGYVQGKDQNRLDIKAHPDFMRQAGTDFSTRIRFQFIASQGNHGVLTLGGRKAAGWMWILFSNDTFSWHSTGVADIVSAGTITIATRLLDCEREQLDRFEFGQ